MDGARGLQACRARDSGSVERQDDPQARSRSDWREFCNNGAKLMTKGAVGVDLDVSLFLFILLYILTVNHSSRLKPH